jgi:predicted transcriptional regulator
LVQIETKIAGLSVAAVKIIEIKKVLDATILTGEDQLQSSVSGAGSADLMDDVLAAATEGCVLLTGVVTDQVVRTSKITGVAAIVFVRGKRPEDRVVELAKSYAIPLLLTRYSLFVASGKLYMEGLRGLDGSW